MNPEHITIMLIGYPEKDFPKGILRHVASEFARPVVLKEKYCDLGDYFEPARRQYNANRILEEIENRYSGDAGKLLALFNVDLFIPILTFIYGQAFLNGKSALVSAYRLRNERYGLPPDEHLFGERLQKEIIHELGHSFGLIHCQNPACVMRSSTYVEDIDQKSSGLCRMCKIQLNSA